MNRWCAILAIALVVATGTAEAQTAETPRRGGTFTYPVPLGDPETFDCHASQTIVTLMRMALHYSTLLKLDPADYPNVSGDAAQSWEVSSDGLTYAFHLFPQVKFHDGTPLTSNDVKVTYERLRDPPPGIVSQRRGQFRDIDRIDTPDERTIIFHLAKINPAMLKVFASPWNCIYSAKKLAEDPRYPKSEVMGSGPFRFAEFVPGSYWRAERFDGYFREGRPYLDTVKVLNMSAPTIGNALIAGQVNADLFGLSIQDQQRVAAARGDTVRKYGPMSTVILYELRLNTERPPFNDPRVRQALNLAIDRWTAEKVLPRVMFTNPIAGAYQRPDSPLAPSREELEKMPGYRPDMTANRAEAKRLLAEAGQSNLKITFTNHPSYSALGIFLIDQWRQIGVQVSQELPESGQFYSRRARGDFQMIYDTAADYVDEPTIQMDKVLSADINPSNTTHLVDHRVDELYEAQTRSADPSQRAAIIRDLDTRLLDDAAIIPLLWSGRTTFADAKLRGLAMAPSEFIGLDFGSIWFAE